MPKLPKENTRIEAYRMMGRSAATPTGEKFGKLTVLSDLGVRAGKHFVSVECACGEIEDRELRALEARRKMGGLSACKKCQGELKRPKDSVIGLVFGMLTVTKDLGYRRNSYDRSRHVDCVCKCGLSVHDRSIKNLRTIANIGGISSCDDCKPKASERSHRPEYKVFINIHRRCYDPKSQGWKDYGGRGIAVDARYHGEDGYDHFIADVGFRPADGYEIDRIKNSRGYEPGNIKWSTRLENNNNRRCTIKMDFRGETLTLQQICDLTGASYHLTHSRLFAFGWDIEKAVSAPIREHLKTRAPASNTKFYEFEGQRLTIPQICKMTAIPYDRIDRRLKAGMSIEDAVKLPPTPRGQRVGPNRVIKLKR